MNAIWITPLELQTALDLRQNEIVVKDSERLDHVLNILKVKTGGTLRVCLINRGLTTATIAGLDKTQLRLVIPNLETLEIPVKHNKKTVLFAGLSRPQTIKKVLEYGTCMGVTHFYFLQTELGEKSYATSKIWEAQHVLHHLCLGLAQSNHYVHLPVVEVLHSWKQIISRLGVLEQRYLCTWQKSIFNHQSEQDAALAIGPERGWTETEEEFWRNLNFIDMSLGESVLRVECALVSALTKLS